MSNAKLIEAIKAGDRAAVEGLVEPRDGLDQEDERGWTPLNYAAGQGDLGLVKLLVEKGADVFRVGRDRRSPYMIALAAGHPEVARFLRDTEDGSPGAAPARAAREYCKAYHLGDLRRFPGWPEGAGDSKGNGGGPGAPAGLDDETIVYLHQDFTVTETMWHGENVLFDRVTPAWEEFCRSEQQFKPPDDFDLIAKSTGGEG